MLPSIKLSGPRVQIFSIEKDSTYGQQITCEYLEMMLFYYSETKKIPPPQKKKRRRDTNGGDMATRTCICL